MTDPPAGFAPGAPVAPVAPPGAAGFELALREHRWLHASGRVEYLAVDAEKARQARLDCDEIEEFMPKPGDAAAIGVGMEIARSLPASESVVVLLSAFGVQDTPTTLAGNSADIARASQPSGVPATAAGKKPRR